MNKLLVRVTCIISFVFVHFTNANKFQNNSDMFVSHYNDGIATQSSGIIYVATTPKIDLTTKNLSRSELLNFF